MLLCLWCVNDREKMYYVQMMLMIIEYTHLSYPIEYSIWSIYSSHNILIIKYLHFTDHFPHLFIEFNLGFRVDQIQECILWMTPFALAIRDEGFDLLRLQKHEFIEKMPNIQVHTVDLKLLVSLSYFIILIFFYFSCFYPEKVVNYLLNC